MPNNLIKLEKIVRAIENNVSELADVGKDGFSAPLVTTAPEVANMKGIPVRPKRHLSNDLIWFCALKTATQAREMLAQAARIFRQVEDDGLAERIEEVIDSFDGQFHPGPTALQAYRRLLRRTVLAERRDED